METLETLAKRIGTTEDLRGIVRTMKALSAVSIRQYDQAVIALREYNRTIELGLQVVLRRGPPTHADRRPEDGASIAVVFGSDHGLCGRFNDQIARFAQTELDRRGVAREDRIYLAVGARAAAQLDAAGEKIEQGFLLPGSADGLTETVHDVLFKLDALRAERRIARALVFVNMRADGGAATPQSRQLLPFDPGWLASLAARRWPSRALPAFTVDADTMFATLVRQHLFIELFRAGAESAASEHAARLAAMQAAERNIEEHLEEMSGAYRRKRQESITEELLDVVAGFEVLTTAESAEP